MSPAPSETPVCPSVAPKRVLGAVPPGEPHKTSTPGSLPAPWASYPEVRARIAAFHRIQAPPRPSEAADVVRPIASVDAWDWVALEVDLVRLGGRSLARLTVPAGSVLLGEGSCIVLRRALQKAIAAILAARAEGGG